MTETQDTNQERQFDAIMAEMRRSIRDGENTADPYAVHRAFATACKRLGLPALIELWLC